MLTFISLCSFSLVVLMEKAELISSSGWYRRSTVQLKQVGGQGAHGQLSWAAAEHNGSFRPTYQNYLIILNTSFLGHAAWGSWISGSGRSPLALAGLVKQGHSLLLFNRKPLCWETPCCYSPFSIVPFGQAIPFSMLGQVTGYPWKKQVWESSSLGSSL